MDRKSIKLSKEFHNRLSVLKVILNMNSYEDVIKILLDFYDQSCNSRLNVAAAATCTTEDAIITQENNDNGEVHVQIVREDDGKEVEDANDSNFSEGETDCESDGFSEYQPSSDDELACSDYDEASHDVPMDCDAPVLQEGYANEILLEKLPEASNMLGSAQKEHYIVQFDALRAIFPSKCPQCNFELTEKKVLNGCVLTLKLECARNGCDYLKIWTSSNPIMAENGEANSATASVGRQLYLTNMMFAIQLVLSGNQFAKVFRLLSNMNIAVMSQSGAENYMDAIGAGTKMFLDKSVDMILSQLPNSIDLQGDGQNDSPGHTAKYCQYTILDANTGYGLCSILVDKRESDLKSPTMELYGCIRALEFLDRNQKKINSITTDKHVQVRKLFENAKNNKADAVATMVKAGLDLTSATNLTDHLENVTHGFDLWHRNKKLGMDLLNASKKKDCGLIKPWINDIKNHFWFCALHCNGNVNVMKNMWHSLLFHVQGIHEWASGKCWHSEIINSDKQPLERNSKAFQALFGIVWNPKFIAELHRYVGFHHTGLTESFNSVRLKYLPKRTAFQYLSMLIRGWLVLLDHNHHRNLEAATTSSGDVYMHRKNLSRGEKWIVCPTKRPKDYAYITHLTAMILYCCTSKTIQSSFRESLFNPMTIASTIASSYPPSTAQLVQFRQSRFKKRIFDQSLYEEADAEISWTSSDSEMDSDSDTSENED